MQILDENEWITKKNESIVHVLKKIKNEKILEKKEM